MCTDAEKRKALWGYEGGNVGLNYPPYRRVLQFNLHRGAFCKLTSTREGSLFAVNYQINLIDQNSCNYYKLHIIIFSFRQLCHTDRDNFMSNSHSIPLFHSIGQNDIQMNKQESIQVGCVLPACTDHNSFNGHQMLLLGGEAVQERQDPVQ